MYEDFPLFDFKLVSRNQCLKSREIAFVEFKVLNVSEREFPRILQRSMIICISDRENDSVYTIEKVVPKIEDTPIIFTPPG